MKIYKLQNRITKEFINRQWITIGSMSNYLLRHHYDEKNDFDIVELELVEKSRLDADLHTREVRHRIDRHKENIRQSRLRESSQKYRRG